jgi:hypothetical protein
MIDDSTFSNRVGLIERSGCTYTHAWCILAGDNPRVGLTTPSVGSGSEKNCWRVMLHMLPLASTGPRDDPAGRD